MTNPAATARRIADAVVRHSHQPTHAFVLIALGLLLALGVVLLDDGTPSAYAHFAYAPTILAALRFRAAGGLCTGFLGGVVVGPLAALILHGHLGFPPGEWISWGVRAGWIALVGATLGSLFHHVQDQARVLQWHLLTDPATDRPNRQGARERVSRLVDAARGSQDLDLLVTSVKITNHDALLGTLGYEGADRMMRSLSERFEEVLPADAILARTGVDELMAVETADAATPSDERVRAIRRLARRTLDVDGISVYVDTAMGVVRAPMAVSTPDELFVQASAAAGRARDRASAVAYYDEAEERARQDGIYLLGELPAALENGDIHLVYQPKLCLHTHRFVGVEALVRWDHPVQGPISPGRFVPLVEDTAIIEDLTRWVLRNALRQLALWRDEGINAHLAVNISTRNLTSGSLLGYLNDLLHENDLPPGVLELEITETAFTDIDTGYVELLEGFREAGVRIAIDDFGTGYASLAYMRELPMDTLKIDRYFVSGLTQREREQQIFHRVAQLARDLHLTVVGEGVEDASTLELLQKLGCDEVQGYLMARPAPAEQVRPLLMMPWRPPDDAGADPAS